MLSGRLALITGAGSGIGRAACRVFAKDGARIIAADLNEDGCRETIQDLSDGDHMTLSTDVSSSASVNDSIKQILDKYKQPPDLVVNSAGITKDTYLLKMTEEQFDQVINVNLKGSFLVTQTAAKAMKKANMGGSIVNISSVIGKTGNVGQSNYSASKAGVIGFTKSAAKELGKFGIRVNCICPGFITTPMTEKVPEHLQQMTLMMIPLGVFGEPEDIAETAAFLASNRAKYITGAAIDVNGGLY